MPRPDAEHEARRLLSLAAATIDVPPQRPARTARTARPRRTPASALALATAAAVLAAVLAGSFAWTRGADRGPGPSGPPAATASDAAPGVTSTNPPDPYAGDQARATGFLEFARGERAFDLGPGPVDLYVDGLLQGRVGAPRLEDRDAWTIADVVSSGGVSGPLSVLDRLAREPVVVRPGSATTSHCLPKPIPVLDDVGGSIVTVLPTDPPVCMAAWAAELAFVGDRLVAVNVILGEL
ncbi:hypothetical protein INN71_06220 [Nocardioides sp. ChNu-153]|uniref:hypothetical protein n=1 Tax=Nocardioides sp. ChNu-153 TaxID=2779364 RepID=UPI0026530DFC|nr:hypothetical protein [Nocardioides sp. ChNu-153]MDN7120982.1 hypothetical protein [Nocardioides sp. ChNu-153]